MRPAVLTALSEDTFTQQVQVGPHRLLSDVAATDGGADAGPSPHEYLAAALASCTAITLRMYARRKGWEMGGLQVSVDIEHVGVGATRFLRTLVLPANLEDEPRSRLVGIANACPVHKTLSGRLEIETQVTHPGIDPRSAGVDPRSP